MLQLFSLRGDGQLFSKSMNVSGIASLRGGKLGAAFVKSGVRITAGGLKVCYLCVPARIVFELVPRSVSTCAQRTSALAKMKPR